MNMFGVLRSWFRGSQEEQRAPVAPHPSETARFVLTFEDLDVGELELRDQHWLFSYTDDFRRQSAVKPLVDFPDATKNYQSDMLWPFFVARLPSATQPTVQAAISEAGAESISEVEMLRRFGGRSISNHFVLEPVRAP